MSATQQQLTLKHTERLSGEPLLPSSKYYTLRYTLASTLASGESILHFPARSDDSDALFQGCQTLGARFCWLDAEQQHLRVQGVGYPQQKQPVTINIGNAGAVTRLLLGISAPLQEVTFVTDHPQSMGKRPNRELLEALTTLGVECESQGDDGYLPITLRGKQIHGGKVQISGARSSQFLSALLYLAPILEEDVEIEVVDGLKSVPFIRTTLEVLQTAGIQLTHSPDYLHFHVPGKQRYQAQEYILPGDYPSAAAWLSIGAVLTDPTSAIRLTRLPVGDEIGEPLLEAFQQLGTNLQRDGETITISGGSRLRAIRCDGDKIIDCIPTLVAAACFADGESVFYNIESLHYKECDRIDDLCAELQKAGCDVIPQRDAIIVRGRPEGVRGGVEVDGHNDHRVLMALATVALRSQEGLTLRGAEHIAKSYPHFFSDLQRLTI